MGGMDTPLSVLSGDVNVLRECPLTPGRWPLTTSSGSCEWLWFDCLVYFWLLAVSILLG